MSVDKQCQSIELMLVDVDGVLTDGSIIFNNEGIEIKQFHIHDGLGIRLWQLRRRSFWHYHRAHFAHREPVRKELGIGIVRQGTEIKWGRARDSARAERDARAVVLHR